MRRRHPAQNERLAGRDHDTESRENDDTERNGPHAMLRVCDTSSVVSTPAKTFRE